MTAVLRRAGEVEAYRISPGDTNHMAILFGPATGGARYTAIVEIFEAGGKTPPNTHRHAEEMFFVLKGNGVAHVDGRSLPFGPGDSLHVGPGTEHVIENTGPGKLYTLTVMTPNEGFEELMLSGARVPLDDEDRAVIAGLGR